jgi:hypothetical protein
MADYDIHQSDPNGPQEDEGVPGLLVANTLQTISQLTRDLAKTSGVKEDERTVGLLEGRTEMIRTLIGNLGLVVRSGQIGSMFPAFPSSYLKTIFDLTATVMAKNAALLEINEFTDAKVFGQQEVLTMVADACGIDLDRSWFLESGAWNDLQSTLDPDIAEPIPEAKAEEKPKPKRKPRSKGKSDE